MRVGDGVVAGVEGEWNDKRRIRFMDLYFKIDLHIKLSNSGQEKAMEFFDDKESILIEVSKGLKELILDELSSEIKSGMAEVDIEITNS